MDRLAVEQVAPLLAFVEYAGAYRHLSRTGLKAHTVASWRLTWEM